MGETTGTTRRTSDLDLRGRRALVTGAASGIGRACARRLAAAGAEVTVLDRDADGAKRVAHELEGRVLVVDLAGPDLDTLRVDTDILVNNAGLQHVAPVQEFPPERFALLLRVMLEAPFRLARAALPGMYERGWGRIVNISSVHGLRASPFKSAYVAAKHGLEGLSKVIALEGGPQGVTSNCICPAYVRTPLVESQIADQARVHGISEDEVVATVMLTEPAIKRLVEPEEVAELAAFLCSEPASFVNGASMTMDGAGARADQGEDAIKRASRCWPGPAAVCSSAGGVAGGARAAARRGHPTAAPRPRRLRPARCAARSRRRPAGAPRAADHRPRRLQAGQRRLRARRRRRTAGPGQPAAGRGGRRPRRARPLRGRRICAAAQRARRGGRGRRARRAAARAHAGAVQGRTNRRWNRGPSQGLRPQASSWPRTIPGHCERRPYTTSRKVTGSAVSRQSAAPGCGGPTAAVPPWKRTWKLEPPRRRTW